MKKKNKVAQQSKQSKYLLREGTKDKMIADLGSINAIDRRY